MRASHPIVEYVSSTQLGEKGQFTIPKQYRDELGLDAGAPIAVLRVGGGLILVPEQQRFRRLCESIGSVLESQHVAPADLLETLPAVRRHVFARRYPTLGARVLRRKPRRER